jgi:uncharacterized membrane protein YbhN (UPF0104 family)
MQTTRPGESRSLLRWIRWGLVLVLVGAALWTLRGRLPSIEAALRATHPRWALVALASLLTLGAYAVLIESWRRTLGELGGPLAAADAAVIWFGSNLARYLPGFGWQIGLMGAMAKDRGVGVAISTGASALVAIASILTGLTVCAAGVTLLAIGPAELPSLNRSALALVTLIALALAASPWILPHVGALAARLTGRPIVLPRVTARSATIAGAGTLVAWLAYGTAFWLLARGVLPRDVPRSLAGCITVYTLSYLVGLFNPLPAGIGATEPVIILLAPQLGIASAAEATVLALFVRAWRTVMEIVPNLAVLGVASVLARGREGHDGAGSGEQE